MAGFGPRVKTLRTERGETQEVVARRAGIALSTYVRIETGTNEPSFNTLGRLAAALEVGIGELVADSDKAAS